MNKPVWRENTGRGVPSDLGDKIFMFGSVKTLNKLYRIDDVLWKIDKTPSRYDIITYQTNRTKPAKYKNIDCGSCLANRAYCRIEGVGDRLILKECKRCNGKGYLLERIK